MVKKKLALRVFLIPIGISLFFSLLYLFDGYRGFEDKLYDLYLGLKPAPEQSRDIVLLDIDNQAIDNVGSYPWPRGLIADGLVLLRELGAAQAVFDIEYVNKSPAGIDDWYLRNGLEEDFQGVFDDLKTTSLDMYQAIMDGRLSLKDALGYVQEFAGYIDAQREDLYVKAKGLALDNDGYLGNAMRAFGSTFITLNLQENPILTNPPESIAIARDRFAYGGPGRGSLSVAPDALPGKYMDFITTLPVVSRSARSAGFTNVVVDTDGIRRRIRLMERIGDKWYPQLVFSAVLDTLGNPHMELGRTSLRLKGARLPDGTVTDLSIPLDPEGNMLINWPKEEYISSFHHSSFWALVSHKRNEDYLAQLLISMGRFNAWTVQGGKADAAAMQGLLSSLQDSIDGRKLAIDTGDPADFDAYAEAKAAYLAGARELLAGDQEKALLDTIASLLAQGQDETTAAVLADEAAAIPTIFDNAASYLEAIDKGWKTLSEQLGGKTCIIGWTATATTDIGTNPFWGDYVNVGTHAAVANTIFQRTFLDVTPSYASALIAVAVSVLLVLLIRNQKPLIQVSAGFGSLILLFTASFAVFALTGLFIGVLAPFLSLFFSFVVYTLVNFLASEREKSFLKKAFSTYLSGDVITELVNDPSKLKLGGQQKWMSAMFTDIRGFSTVSEKLSAEQLVKLLNIYLSGMSDIILENKGTIDKFEGDAIISFYGAPLDLPTHAAAACRAAVLMKRKERELNERFLAEAISPTPLLTRIGLNTGEMVVGNMGTEAKMNYTIMGNAVNLAARLEGVNKQYGSWILASDAVVKEIGGEFLTRAMCRVRVVGINTPVQLHEIVDIRSEAKPARVETVEAFARGMELFERKDYAGAERTFQEALKIDPEDLPSKNFSGRAAEYIRNPPLPDWDGVFNMNEK